MAIYMRAFGFVRRFVFACKFVSTGTHAYVYVCVTVFMCKSTYTFTCKFVSMYVIVLVFMCLSVYSGPMFECLSACVFLCECMGVRM